MRTAAMVAVPAAAVLLGGLLYGTGSPTRSTPAAPGSRVGVGTAATLSTSRTSLRAVVLEMRQRVESSPGDGEAAVLLADALMRSARVEGDASLPLEAERVIRSTLAHDPRDYAARRMLGVVLLSQHRFAAALAAAEDARRVAPDDPWNYAVIGDALLELGRYEEAFDAIDELNRRRPDSGAYARAAYARELQGDIAGAIEAMQMAAEATGAHDPEAQAWYLSQLGNLHMLEGRLDEANRAFARAAFVFPEHPYARMGQARALIAAQRYREADAVLAGASETPETWAIRGDIAARLGDQGAAQRAYRKAERLEREGWEQEEPQPAALARFLAERRLDVDEAVTLAERAAGERRDIYTMDALAWAYFQAGQRDRASEAIRAALRTGTRDPRIRCHAAAIAAAREHGGLTATDPCPPLDLSAAAAKGER